MRIDLDRYREIIETLTRNKTRSLLTGFGVFWGVFMLVALLGGSAGMQEMLNRNFSGFATNSAVIFSRPTTKAYMGFNRGRVWQMDIDDPVRLKHLVEGLDVATPLVFCGHRTVTFGDNSVGGNPVGAQADYAKVMLPEMRYGRFLNDMDDRQGRKVCVIGKKVYTTLFPDGGDPCGKMVRIDSTYYTVVGVDNRMASVNIGTSPEDAVYLPLGLVQKVYNRGRAADIIALTAKPGVRMSSVAERVRLTVAKAHTVAPDDRTGVTVFNTEELYIMMDNVFKGVSLLTWLIGIGTLLAGAVGVSNIMMVTVRERTSEIGIRRAIGATPRMILTQIVSESVVLTVVAGMSGIMFAVAILEMAELSQKAGGMAAAHFQVDFLTALAAAAIVGALGVVAGLAPAWRAMSIKPVDAMRDE